MAWLTNLLAQEFLLVIAIVVAVSVFIVAARKAHLNHLDKIKKINDSFNIK